MANLLVVVLSDATYGQVKVREGAKPPKNVHTRGGRSK
jgi:hypothetical protein